MLDKGITDIPDFLFKHRKLLALGFLDKESDDILLNELDPAAKRQLILVRTILNNQIEDALGVQNVEKSKQVWTNFANSNTKDDEEYKNFFTLLNAGNLNQILAAQIQNLKGHLDLQKTQSRMFEILASKIKGLEEEIKEKKEQKSSLEERKSSIMGGKAGQQKAQLDFSDTQRKYSIALNAYKNSPHKNVENKYEEIFNKLKENIENTSSLKNQSIVRRQIHDIIITSTLQPKDKFKIYDRLTALQVPKPSATEKFFATLTRPFAKALNKLGIGNGQGLYEQKINDYETITQAVNEMKSIPQFHEVKQKFESMHESRENMLASSSLEDLTANISQYETEITELEKLKGSTEKVYKEKLDEDKAKKTEEEEQAFYERHGI